jgi:hypothetical protein
MPFVSNGLKLTPAVIRDKVNFEFDCNHSGLENVCFSGPAVQVLFISTKQEPSSVGTSAPGVGRSVN